MPHKPQLIDYFRFYSRRDCNIAMQRLAVNSKTRHLYRSLDAHPVIDNIRNKLRMCQWLSGAAHDSEADVDIVFFHERGNEGVKGTLARSERIGVAGVAGEKGAAILDDRDHAE